MEVESQFDAGRYSFKIETSDFSMSEYNTFVTSVANDVQRFKRKQALGVVSEEARENELFAKWIAEKQRHPPQEPAGESNIQGFEEATGSVISSLSATIWKIKCSPGTIIQSGEDVVMVLEAMKTEINVEAGEENVGLTVLGFGKGVKEGAAVSPGDVLIVLK